MANTNKFIAVSVFIVSLLFACKADKNNAKKLESEAVSQTDSRIIEIVTRSMEFQMVDTLKSGWNTFLYKNLSNETHFFLLEKLPDGVRLDNYKKELIPPFENAFNHFLVGNFEAGSKELERIPKWFFEVQLYGGVGLLSPKTTAQSTIYLDPGYYAMECYIRMPNGKPHALMGMLKELVVLDENSKTNEPSPDLEVFISTADGISFNDTLTPGTKIIKVNFTDQKTYETLLGHDVNLVRLENLHLVDSLNNWINPADLNQFRSPSPQGIEFLGGVNDLQAGQHGYFTVNVSSGTYAFVSEVPNALQKNMLKVFEVK